MTRIYIHKISLCLKQVAAEGAVLLINDGVLPLTAAKLASIRSISVVGPNSGCVGDTPSDVPPGQCATTEGVDCGGSFDKPGDGSNNIALYKNVKSSGDCCNLCLNATNCTVAVYYTPRDHPRNAGQCQMKTICDQPTAAKGSILIHTARVPPRKPERATPVGCHAQ